MQRLLPFPVHVSVTGLLVHGSKPSPPDTGDDFHDDPFHFLHFDSAYCVQAFDDWKIHAVADELSNLDASVLALSPAQNILAT